MKYNKLNTLVVYSQHSLLWQRKVHRKVAKYIIAYLIICFKTITGRKKQNMTLHYLVPTFLYTNIIIKYLNTNIIKYFIYNYLISLPILITIHSGRYGKYEIQIILKRSTNYCII